MKSSHSTPPLYPCLRGDALAKQGPGAIYLPQLRALVSAPSDRYSELYTTTLYRFMELCQALPLTSPCQNQGSAVTAAPYSLLNRAFSLAVAALTLRRGWLMSLYPADSEKIAQQEPLWTYALFTTVLFHAIPSDWQTAYTVGLYQNKEKRLGTWHPVIGSLYEPQTFYQIEKTPEQKPYPVVDPAMLLTTWTGRLIPAIALRWLGDSEVFPAWWEALTQISLNSQNPLFKHVRQVAEKLGISFAESPVSSVSKPASERVAQPAAPSSTVTLPPVIYPTKTPLSPARQALNRLNQWLTTQQESAATTDLPFLRVEQGLLIEEAGLQRIIGQYTQYASVEVLIQTLSEFLVADPKKTFLVCYRPKRMESREIRRGVVLAQSHLTEAFQRLPVREDYIPDLFAR